MLWIEPHSTVLMGTLITGVRAITSHSSAKRVLEEWTDGGPYATFIDVADISIEIVIERDATADAFGLLDGVSPGDQGVLRFIAAPSGASAHAEAVSAIVVVTAVKHILHGGSGPVQTIVCRAVSQDGVVRPIGPADGGSA